MLLPVVKSCCAKFGTGQTFSYVQRDATTPNTVLHVALGNSDMAYRFKRRSSQFVLKGLGSVHEEIDI